MKYGQLKYFHDAVPSARVLFKHNKIEPLSKAPKFQRNLTLAWLSYTEAQLPDKATVQTQE